MPLDPDIAAALRVVEQGGWLPLAAGSPQTARESYRALSLIRRGEGYVPEPVADVRDRSIDGPGGPLTVRVYTPSEASRATVVFLHGGGWVIGDLDTHDPMCRALANATGAVVASVDYRLAPESPYPAALRDSMAALRWAAQTWPEHRLAVAGDSAGGGLAAGAAMRARDDDGPALVAQLLIYPSVDPLMTQPSVIENGEGYFLTRADMEWFTGHYLPDSATRTDPAVNLLSAPDLSGLPPAVVAVAEFVVGAAVGGPAPACGCDPPQPAAHSAVAAAVTAAAGTRADMAVSLPSRRAQRGGDVARGVPGETAGSERVSP